MMIHFGQSQSVLFSLYNYFHEKNIAPFTEKIIERTFYKSWWPRKSNKKENI
jgi:hypothetical protein